MTARLILARHGNTFKPEDTPVWVGARTDLPLVEKGLAQAQALADVLRDAAIIPGVLIAGPLQRTRQMASIIAKTLKISADAVRIDPRLKEIDYGSWEGKSTDEIVAAGAGAELAAWNKTSVFPVSPGWNPSEAQIIVDTCSILAKASEGTSLIITSNGILRFFARAAVNAGDFPDSKVATGHICVMERDNSRSWRITQWNQPPERFAQQISA
ncbi:MAG: histidine phosphatase family protein [Alphaproteobacteria bacterium]